MTLYKTGVKSVDNGATYWHDGFLGYQAASQRKALTQAKIKRKGSNWVAVVEQVTEADLIDIE